MAREILPSSPALPWGKTAPDPSDPSALQVGKRIEVLWQLESEGHEGEARLKVDGQMD